MGRGRTPCCDKAGVKKGPWSQVEDLRLISFIQKHGHPNWRALPKQAGLLRCGKSCRLRWINYLRPDIKRGNFSREEEETIFKLHDLLGNKWSKIASQLPGRTDNEIKNFWNTHLKKRLIVKASPCTDQPNKESLTNSSPCSSSVSNGLQDMEMGPGSDSANLIIESFDQSSQPKQLSKQMMSSTDEPIELSSSSTSSDEPGNEEEPPTELFSSDKLCKMNVKAENVNKEDLSEGVIEIPIFEPNVDFWDMIDADFSADPEAPVSEVQTDQQTISEEENKGEVESWWWLAYLENELGLEATMESAADQPPVPTLLNEELLSKSEIDPVVTYFHHTWPTSPRNLGF